MSECDVLTSIVLVAELSPSLQVAMIASVQYWKIEDFFARVAKQAGPG